MTIIVYTISAPAPIDAEDTDLKQYQPTGWCYVCGSASWVWDQSGPLCPSHANALDAGDKATARRLALELRPFLGLLEGE